MYRIHACWRSRLGAEGRGGAFSAIQRFLLVPKGFHGSLTNGKRLLHLVNLMRLPNSHFFTVYFKCLSLFGSINTDLDIGYVSVLNGCKKACIFIVIIGYRISYKCQIISFSVALNYY